jgi:uncharacterized membrane protein YqjE
VPHQSPSGLLAHAQALLAGVLDLGHSRLALARVEIEQERLHLAGLLIWACAGLFMLGVGLVLLALLLVLLSWNGPREWVLGGLTLAYLLAAAAACWRWRHLAAQKPPLLAATLAELKRDQAALMDTLR